MARHAETHAAFPSAQACGRRRRHGGRSVLSGRRCPMEISMFGLSIRSLLMGLFGLMALIIGGEGLLAIDKISAVNNSVVEIANNWMPSINVIRQINTIAEQRRANVARHILMTTDEEMKAQEEVFKKLNDTFEAARKRYEPMISAGEERRTYESFSKYWADYQPIGDEVLKL